MRGRARTVAALGFLGAVACTSESIHLTSLRGGGSDGSTMDVATPSHDAKPGSGSDSGSTTAKPDSDSQPRFDASSAGACRFRLPAVTDTRPWPPSCDGAPSDAGQPPTYCVAPCLWELVRSCLAEGPCKPENEMPSFTLGQYAGYEVCVDGRVCASFSRQGTRPGTFATDPGYPLSWYWSDSHGVTVACGGAVARADPLRTACAPCGSGDRYPLELDRPECAPWLWLYRYVRL